MKKNATIHNRSWRHRNREKARAHAAVNNAVRTGKLIPLPCEVCGNSKSQAHHDDYSKRLTVRWLCAAHHSQQHGGRDPEKVLQNRKAREARKREKRRLLRLAKPKTNSVPKPSKRRDLASQAIALHQEGLCYREIGMRLGISKGHAYKCVNQPEYS